MIPSKEPLEKKTTNKGSEKGLATKGMKCVEKSGDHLP